MIHEGFEKPHDIEPLPLWKYQGLARDIENAKKEITEHLNAELKRFREECDKAYDLLKIREEGNHQIGISKEFEEAGFTYRDPYKEEGMSPRLKEKLELAKKITENTQIINLQEKNEKSSRKTPKRKA